MVPEKLINEFVSRTRHAAEPNLESIILYGSAASGSFDAEFSNINLLFVLKDAGFPSLQKLAPAMGWWHRQKQAPPLIMSGEELNRSTDVFSIELLDMKQHHRILFGQDVLQSITVAMHLHRVQVEYELREKLVLLRQRAVIVAGDDKRLWELLTRSAPSFVTLFRHALIALGESATGKRETVDRLSKRVGFDPAAIYQVLDVREHKLPPKSVDVKALFARYLAAVEKVTAAVDQALDS